MFLRYFWLHEIIHFTFQVSCLINKRICFCVLCALIATYIIFSIWDEARSVVKQNNQPWTYMVCTSIRTLNEMKTYSYCKVTNLTMQL